MGALRNEPFASFVGELQASLGLTAFVETGTYRGETTEFAASRFPRVVTVEIREDYRQETMERLAGVSNVEFLAGDSGEVLRDVAASLEGPAMFWLDGHAGGGWFGSEERCPVLAELEAIASSPWEHVIFVDDARAFLAPPPPPFDPAVWPPISDVLEAARRRHSYACAVLEDIIVCLPPDQRPRLVEFSVRIRPKI